MESPFSVKNADQVKAVLRTNPNINAYFAPFDEFAKGVVMAFNETNMTDKVKVYSADISTQDIQLMTKPNSPWVATAATNSAAVGAISARAIALRIAKQKFENDLYIPRMLFTSKILNEAGVKTMTQLPKKFSKFNNVDVATASWIPVDKKVIF